jgi:DNA-binding NarL/FixJ family response regulator
MSRLSTRADRSIFKLWIVEEAPRLSNLEITVCSNMKIFVVEDSAVTQGILKEELARIPGVQLCGMALGPDEAITSIKELAPDIVILDIVLKGGNGFEVLKRLRSEEIDVRVLVLTNYTFPHYREICRGMGADYFFDKSLDMDRALRTVRDMACG